MPAYEFNHAKYNNYSSNTTMIEHRSNPFIEQRSSLKNSVVSRSNSYERSISYHQYQEKLKNDNRHYESKLKNLKDKILALQVTGPLNSQLNSQRLFSAKNGSLGMMITPTVRDLNG
jgi:hypothetical protein